MEPSWVMKSQSSPSHSTPKCALSWIRLSWSLLIRSVKKAGMDTVRMEDLVLGLLQTCLPAWTVTDFEIRMEEWVKIYSRKVIAWVGVKYLIWSAVDGGGDPHLTTRVSFNDFPLYRRPKYRGYAVLCFCDWSTGVSSFFPVHSYSVLWERNKEGI